jgi:hypothetical protein
MLAVRIAVVAMLFLPVSASALLQQVAATFENGRYRQANITFDVPVDWTYVDTRVIAPGQATAHWSDPRTGANLYVWMRQENVAAADIAPFLDRVVTNKTQQRARDGYQQWRVRPESISRPVLGGNQALAAVADYTSRGTGAPRVELLTWVVAAEGRALFFAFVAPDQVATFQPEFDQVVRSARLP